MCKPLFLYVAMFLVFGLSFTLAAENQEPDDSGEDERLILVAVAVDGDLSDVIGVGPIVSAEKITGGLGLKVAREDTIVESESVGLLSLDTGTSLQFLNTSFQGNDFYMGLDIGYALRGVLGDIAIDNRVKDYLGSNVERNIFHGLKYRIQYI